jgi:serine/threonine protein kinase
VGLDEARGVVVDPDPGLSPELGAQFGGRLVPRSDDETRIFPEDETSAVESSASGQNPRGGETGSGIAPRGGPASKPRRGIGSPRGSGGDRDLILDAFRQADDATVATPSRGGPGSAADLPINHFPGYILKGEIHRGGQGVVYKAEQPSTGRMVAIKLMHGGGAIGTTGRARFDLEVQVLGRLDHPGIVGVYDSGVTEDGSVYYVMEYIGGQPLDVLIREWRREAERIRGEAGAGPGARPGTPEDGVSRVTSRTSALGSRVLNERLEMFAKICEGVSAAHIAGVIHRDLKPANIRLDKRGEPVVVDFGLAKMLADDQRAKQPAMTATGQFVGSMPWSSPEQAEGSNKTIDTRSDVYSLGVILYQMVTGGKFPYTVVGTARQVMNNIVTAEPKRPSLFDRGINDEIETIVLKALSKEPERRYQSAADLAKDIRRYLDGEAIEAKRDSTWYVMTKALRRHRVSAGFVAALLLMGTAFSVALAAKYTENEGLRIQAEDRLEQEEFARSLAETERARAEENFSAVHDMSRAFLFDFHDEIKNLRGAAGARAMLVGQATRYLERLRTQAEASPDPDMDLMLDLAAAHDRLAAVQAGFAESNQGDSADAEASVAEAERIRDGLIELIPDDSRLWLGIATGAEQRGRVEQAKGNFDDALAHGGRGLEAVSRADQLGAGDGEADAARVALLTMMGDVEHRLGRASDSAVVASDHLRASLGHYEAAMAIVEAGTMDPGEVGLIRADLLARRARSTTEIARWIVRGVMRNGDGDQAGDGPDLDDADRIARDGLELAEASVAAFAGLREDDASARDALRGMITTLREESLAWETLGRIATERGEDGELAEHEAFAASQEALDYAQVLAGDETDLDAQRLLGIMMNSVGNALRVKDRLDEAELLYDELIPLRRGIVATDPTTRHSRDLAIAVLKRAQIDEYRARTLQGDEAVALYEAAERRYAEAGAIFEALAADGVPMEREINEIARVIERVRTAAAAAAGE